MLISKSLGQILRVSGAMHTLFNLECEEVGSTITKDAIDAAIHFVEVCCQQAAYIAGTGELDKELELIVKGVSLYMDTHTVTFIHARVTHTRACMHTHTHTHTLGCSMYLYTTGAKFVESRHQGIRWTQRTDGTVRCSSHCRWESLGCPKESHGHRGQTGL